MTERVQPTAEQLKQQLAQADHLQVTGQWPEARQAYTDIIESPSVDGRIRTDSLHGRGVANRMLGQYRDAHRDFSDAWEGARYLDDPQREVIALVGQIDLARTGDRDPNWIGKSLGVARMYRETAEAIIERMPPEWNRAKVEAYINFGLLDLECGNPQEALANYEKAEEGCRQLLEGDSQDNKLRNRLARVLTIKGVALERLDRINEAQEAQAEAFLIYRELGDVRGIVNSARSSGQLFIKMGHLSLAKLSYEVALEAITAENGQILDPTAHALVTQELAELDSKESPK